MKTIYTFIIFSVFLSCNQIEQTKKLSSSKSQDESTLDNSISEDDNDNVDNSENEEDSSSIEEDTPVIDNEVEETPGPIDNNGHIDEVVNPPQIEEPETLPPSNEETTSKNLTIPKTAKMFWQLTGDVRTDISYEYYDIDLEDNEKDIQAFTNNLNKKVICYFSAGSYENWRSDKDLFQAADLGKNLDGWAGERWLDVRRENVRNIMRSRLVRAKQAGCFAVEPDNVDGYDNDNGLNLSESDQIDFLHWLAEEAHKLDLSIGLKNSLGLIEKGNLQDHFDWALNEECYKYNECAPLKKFTEKNKAVFIAEYAKTIKTTWCGKAKANEFFLVFYNLDLNGKSVLPCE